MTLLHLRDIASRSSDRLTIVSEMLDVRNRDLADVTQTDDFIVSEQIVSLYLAQVAEDRRQAAIFTELLDAEGVEIHLKPIADYVRHGHGGGLRHPRRGGPAAARGRHRIPAAPVGDRA